MADLNLYVRIGDDDDYRTLGTIAQLASLLHSVGITEFESRAAGLNAPGYYGNNYVSVYWGRAAHLFDRNLTYGELAQLRRRLTVLSVVTPAEVPVATPVSKRCFEFRDPPRHNKFWTIEVVGTTAFVTYGKIGSAGATQVKAFPSVRAVQEFAAKMESEKRGKGYVGVSPNVHPGAPAQQLAAAGGTPLNAVVQAPPREAAAPAAGDRHIDL